MKVTVVGAGIMGLAAAWALQRDGHQVTVYEQGQIPNSLGASVDQHRLIRFPYGNQLGYTSMVFSAYQAWEQLWTDIGKKLYAQTGTLIIAGTEASKSWASSSAETLEQFGISVEWLNTEQLKSKFPLFLFHEIEQAFYLNSGGVLLAEQIIQALSEYLINQGVTFYTQTPVDEIDSDRARIVLSNKEIIDADVLVIAAGSWINRLLPDFCQRVTPSRQLVVYLEAPAFLANKWTHAPIVLNVDPKAGFYLVPPVLGTQIKVADDSITLTGNPDSQRVVDEMELLAINQLCQQQLTDFNQYSLKGNRICFYTMTPEESFIIESKGSSWIMSGFSGHGFKFGPLLGLALAKTIAGCYHKDELTQWAAGNSTEMMADSSKIFN